MSKNLSQLDANLPGLAQVEITTELFLRRRYSCLKQSYARRLRSSESATSRRGKAKEEEGTHLVQSFMTALGSCGLHCSCAVVLTQLNKWCAADLCMSPQQTRVQSCRLDASGREGQCGARNPILEPDVLREQRLFRSSLPSLRHILLTETRVT